MVVGNKREEAMGEQYESVGGRLCRFQIHSPPQTEIRRKYPDVQKEDGYYCERHFSFPRICLEFSVLFNGFIPISPRS